jgi:hypothetical protein
MAGCVQAPPLGLLDVSARPAERALLAGLKAYDDANTTLPTVSSAKRSRWPGVAARSRRGAQASAFIHARPAASATASRVQVARQADRNFALDNPSRTGLGSSATPSPPAWCRRATGGGAQAARLHPLRRRTPRRVRGRVQARSPGRSHLRLDKSEAGHPVWGPVYKKLQP